MKISTIKDLIVVRKNAILEAITDFCQHYLDEEYLGLCIKMLEKLSRKRSVPFNSGQINSWAAGIIYAIGQVNFLFDKAQRYPCAIPNYLYFLSSLFKYRIIQSQIASIYPKNQSF